jgi:hypothetical protein
MLCLQPRKWCFSGTFLNSGFSWRGLPAAAMLEQSRGPFGAAGIYRRGGFSLRSVLFWPFLLPDFRRFVPFSAP